MKTVISFKLDEKIKSALKDLAEEEHRSLSNYVTMILIKHLEENSIDWRKEEE